MPYVITEKCLGERYADCIGVCPVNCIYPGEYNGEVFCVVDPEVCIDCGACLPACPIDAIVPDVDDSPEWAVINADLSPQWKDNAPIETRPEGDPPRKPGNVRVH